MCPIRFSRSLNTGIGVFCVASSDLKNVMLYTSEKRLKFDVARSVVYDQNDGQYFDAAIPAYGTVYLPADLSARFSG